MFDAMYESFFGLTREPFSVTPDPRFLYMSAKHREALAHLNNGLRQGGGFVVLTGEIGAGKTTVWRHFLEQLPSNFDVAAVVNPRLGVDALLARVCEDLGVQPPDGGTIADPIDAIHGHLMLTHAQSRRALIVVDEAQVLSTDVLELLRLLTNLVVSSDRKLVQVLLIGQPELRTLLEKPVLEPVAQRVVARFHLPALSQPETARYVAHRLQVAGLSGPVPFDDGALQRIHRLCGGVPRRINVLCDRALIAAHAAGQRRVDRKMVDTAAGEVFGRRPAVAPTLQRLAIGTAVSAAVLGAIWLGPSLAPMLAPSVAPLAQAGPASAAAASTVATAPAPPPAANPAVPVPMANAIPPEPPLAPTPVAPKTPAPVPLASLAPLFDAASSAEAPAWRALAALWNATLGDGDPCEAAAHQSLHCYRTRGGLGPIRQLDRPGIVKLFDERGRVAQVLVTGLDADSAVLRAGGTEHVVPLALLAQAWRGEFATLWRAPPGYRPGELVLASDPLAPWLGQRLGAVETAASAPHGGALNERIFAFQLAQGLEPDGLAGPLTLMQINLGWPTGPDGARQRPVQCLTDGEPYHKVRRPEQAP
jgi:general secretion pathway protein A